MEKSLEARAARIEIGTVVALIGLALTLLTGAAALGRRDEKIDTLEGKKLDREEYYRDLGDMRADIRVMRCQVVRDCEQGTPRQAGEGRR
jgi:hypothetical protein